MGGCCAKAVPKKQPTILKKMNIVDKLKTNQASSSRQNQSQALLPKKPKPNICKLN